MKFIANDGKINWRIENIKYKNTKRNVRSFDVKSIDGLSKEKIFRVKKKEIYVQKIDKTIWSAGLFHIYVVEEIYKHEHRTRVHNTIFLLSIILDYRDTKRNEVDGPRQGNPNTHEHITKVTYACGCNLIQRKFVARIMIFSSES